MRKARKVKWQMCLGFEEAASLEELKDETEASSRSEVIREALALYRCIINETRKGGVISIQHSDGSAVSVALRGVEVVKRASGSRGDSWRSDVQRPA